jgi:DNA-binding XRE family transcriptional regulator
MTNTKQIKYTVDGDKVRALRANQFMSIRDAAEKAGVSPFTWSQIELGHRKAQVGTVRKMADALSVDPGEIATCEEKES